MGDVTVADDVGIATLNRGTRRCFAVPVAALATNSVLQLPVQVVIGRRAGPCLAVVAGVHGDESEGILAVGDLFRDQSVDELQGSLLLVPVANPPAFAAHQRRSPLDGLDLNRIFPGNASGSPSERIAERLFRLVVNNARFLVTLHSWYSAGSCLPHVEFQRTPSPVLQASMEAAFAAGFDYVRGADWHPGLLPRAVTAAGIPAIEVEIGGMGQALPENRSRQRNYIGRLMRHLGMLDGPIPPAVRDPVYESTDVLAGSGGILRLSTVLGARVRSGDCIASVSDIYGIAHEELRAYSSGTVIACRSILSVAPGDIVVRILVRGDAAAP